MANEKEFLAFLIETSGGEEAARERFQGAQLKKQAEAGNTLAQTREAAKKGGWLDWFDGLALSEVASLVKGSKGSSGATKQGSKRISKSEVVAAVTPVLEAAKAPMKASDLISATGGSYSGLQMRNALDELVKSGMVTKSGKSKGTEYSWKAEAVKPSRRPAKPKN